MTERIDAAEFNPQPTSEGFSLWEHWETDARGKRQLLLVSSSTVGMELRPGDFILHRHWAPASTPIVHNRAAVLGLTAGQEGEAR